MESQMKPGFDGTQGHVGGGGAVRIAEYVLRLVVVATTLVAAVVMGVAKETKTVDVQIVPTLPALPVTATAKSGYSSAFVYFIVVNAIACAYAALSLALSMVKRKGTKGLTLFLAIADVAMVALLFSGNGAAAAIGVVGQKGNSHIGWNKICNVYGGFCTHVTASIVVSLLGSLAYVLIVSLYNESLQEIPVKLNQFFSSVFCWYLDL